MPAVTVITAVPMLLLSDVTLITLPLTVVLITLFGSLDVIDIELALVVATIFIEEDKGNV